MNYHVTNIPCRLMNSSNSCMTRKWITQPIVQVYISNGLQTYLMNNLLQHRILVYIHRFPYPSLLHYWLQCTQPGGCRRCQHRDDERSQAKWYASAETSGSRAHVIGGGWIGGGTLTHNIRIFSPVLLAWLRLCNLVDAKTQKAFATFTNTILSEVAVGGVQSSTSLTSISSLSSSSVENSI